MLPDRLELRKYQRINAQSSPFSKLRYSTVVDHQARYQFAATQIRQTGSTIIDAASGSGWGTVYLCDAVKPNMIFGLDHDNDALAEAQKHSSNRPNVYFLKANLLNREDLSTISPVDWIVSFETLEHFPKADAQIFLDNLHSLHTGEGKLIISSPNGPIFSPYHGKEKQPWYRYHCVEYSSQELVDLLEMNHWGVTTLYGQKFVDQEKYLKLSKIVYLSRLIGQKMGLPWDHTLCRLPLIILQTAATLSSESQVIPITDGKKQPMALTAVCEATKQTSPNISKWNTFAVALQG